MLKENIKQLRKSRGLSQEELAIKLNVVRQTISKWEQGLSVPDSEMLVSISEVLETPVSTLLGENISESKVDDMKAISEKLEVINLQLLQKKDTRRKTIHWILISLCAVIIIIFISLFLLNSLYLNWDYNNPENAVLGVAFHSFEWIFVRIAPIILIVSIARDYINSKESLKLFVAQILYYNRDIPSNKRKYIFFYRILKEGDIMNFNSKNRTEKLKVRVSEEEKTLIQAKAEMYGYRYLSN